MAATVEGSMPGVIFVLFFFDSFKMCEHTHISLQEEEETVSFFFIFRPQLKEMGRPGPFPVGGKDVT